MPQPDGYSQPHFNACAEARELRPATIMTSPRQPGLTTFLPGYNSPPASGVRPCMALHAEGEIWRGLSRAQALQSLTSNGLEPARVDVQPQHLSQPMEYSQRT